MQKFDLDKNERIIREGWYAGIIICLISLLMLLIGVPGNNLVSSGRDNEAYYTIVDIIGIFALSNGLLQKSRLCAGILPVYFLAFRNSFFLSMNFPLNIAGLIGILSFTAVFIRSAYAVFKYYKFSKLKNIHADVNIGTE